MNRQPQRGCDVTVTNRVGRRSALKLAPPTGQFVVTIAW